ncbi:hypothetical protein Tco_0779843 [Tanacetum coccineum]
MTSITAQQTKLGLELGRDFDPLPSKEDTVSFLRDLGHTRVINSLNDVVVDQMHQPWRTFAALINRSLSGKTSDFTYQIDNKEFKKQEKIYYLRFTKGKKHLRSMEQFYLNKIQESLSIQEGNRLAPGDKEPVKKGKRLKTPAKKSTSKPATGIIIREPHVETKSKGKEKEKVDVAHGKGIELLSEVALSEKAQMKEAKKKSLRDFHKTRPSGSCTVAEKPPSVEKITPTITSEGTSNKPGVLDVTNDDSSENSDQDEESNDDDQEQEDFDQENESEDDEMKSDEEQGKDDTTDQFDDDADARLEKPTETATGIV